MSINLRTKILMFTAIAFTVFALLWGLAPYTAINLPARFIIDVLDWPLDSLATPLDRNTMWLSSIGAGLLGMFGIMLGGVVVPAVKSRDKNIIKTTILAAIFWYVVDGVGSVASGVPSNVFFNTIYLALIVVPLVGISDDSS